MPGCLPGVERCAQYLPCFRWGGIRHRGIGKRGQRIGTGEVMRQIHAYENKGLKFIEDLNGWFSGLLVDLREEKVVLFNDRYGLSRVYYHAIVGPLLLRIRSKGTA